MRKLTITLSFIALAATLSIHAQDKVVTFQPEGKNKLLYQKGLSNGLFYTVTGIEKGSATIVNYDADLNVKFEKSIPTTKYVGLPVFFGRGHNASPIYYDLKVTNSGKHSVSYDDKMILDEKGEYKNFNFKEYYEEYGDLKNEPEIKFYSDNYVCFIGKKDKKRNEPKDENYYILRRSLEDQSTKEIKLTLPTIIKSDEKKIYFALGSVFSDRFYLINKEFNEDKTVNIHNIVGYNYDGEIISKVSLNVKLKNKYHHFTLSNCGRGIISESKTWGDGQTFFTLDLDATSNVYVDTENKCYYIYGLYSNEKFSLSLGAVYNGFYVQKYNFDGDLMWTSENEIIAKNFNKKSSGQYVESKFYLLKDNTIGFQISTSLYKYSFMYLLNNVDGKITKKKNVELKIDGNTYNVYRGGSFQTGYMVKEEFGKLKLDKDALFAAFVSPKAESFLKSQNKEAELNYGCSINEKGIYFLEENPKENKFRLMKFNW